MANAYTTNYNLAKPANGDVDWHIPINGNFDTIDTTMKTISDKIPPGVILMYGAPTAPTGWLECDGSAVSRTTYSSLFAIIGTTFGVGDGSTTFNLPDLRGEFVRGWDNERGVDSERVLGSSQEDEFKQHSHQIGAWNTSGPYAAGDIYTGKPGGRTTEVGGTETRPRNVALMFIIKT
jgi:phage-related tail fiber protein